MDKYHVTIYIYYRFWIPSCFILISGSFFHVFEILNKVQSFLRSLIRSLRSEGSLRKFPWLCMKHSNHIQGKFLRLQSFLNEQYIEPLENLCLIQKSNTTYEILSDFGPDKVLFQIFGWYSWSNHGQMHNGAKSEHKVQNNIKNAILNRFRIYFV